MIRRDDTRAWAAERRAMRSLSASDILGVFVIAAAIAAVLAVAADPEAITSLIARAFLSAVQ